MLKLYLSSSFSATDLGGGDLLATRSDMKSRALRHGVEVKLGEEDPAVIRAVAAGNDLGILEGCARLMGECDAFFGMLFQRHGSTIVLDREPTEVRAAVSFFEAELLEASMTSKPIYVVHDRRMPPSPSMQSFLRLVGGTLGTAIEEIDRADLFGRFDAFCEALAKRETRASPWLLDSISAARLHRLIAPEAKQPKLAFLNGFLREDGAGDCDETVLRAALERAEVGTSVTGEPLGQLGRLSYLWIGVRELAKAPAKARQYELGDAHTRTLRLWNSSAAWYGLHGAHPMGCLAALNDLTFVARQQKTPQPIGARASAYYSIGGRLRARPAARRFYRQCLKLAHILRHSAHDDPSGALQLSASAQARLAMHKEYWRYPLALADFKASLDWRTRHNADPIVIGEALASYGHALFFLPWRRREGLKLVKTGVELIRQQPGGERNGFYFRAARRLAEMLLNNGEREGARDIAAETLGLADAAQAFDQSHTLKELVARIDSSR